MTTRHRFRCPECGANVVVDSDVRDGILEDGCPLCDGRAEEGDFEELASEELESDEPESAD